MNQTIYNNIYIPDNFISFKLFYKRISLAYYYYIKNFRCMDCGVPFCQSKTGCPLSNVIPKWNDLVVNVSFQHIFQVARCGYRPEVTTNNI